MQFTFKVWQQTDSKKRGRFTTYTADNVSPSSSFLELVKYVNHRIIEEGGDPIASEGGHNGDGCKVDGLAVGLLRNTTLSQLHMSSFEDGETIIIEPQREETLPMLGDLIVNRDLFNKTIQSGNFIAVSCGGARNQQTISLANSSVDATSDGASRDFIAKLSRELIVASIKS
ncbi:MAG: hypothetical protein GY854_23710 [Deltaproteobacteria bacterium]|nr:hypothetical protein [Deltaproteobacteria bacterium]